MDTHRLVAAAAAAACVLALATAPARAEDDDGADPDAAPSTETKRDRGVNTTAMCIDAEIADRLAVKRKRRGAVDRLFIKQARHELTLSGGYYASDLFSATYVTGAAYTFHMTEDTAVEFGIAMTHENADIIDALEDARGDIIDEDFARTLFGSSILLWTPIYGKFRMGGTIMRFDIHLDAGVGVVDSGVSRGAAGIGGIGFKLFMGKALAFRVDARDHVFRQELLDERFLVNDVSVTAGLSVFLPFKN